ncbi:hypothetical protein [Mycoplasmopsis gallinacea]|uniref:Uncharacterized protein n=1 Tax=Mycoplasmopsis gallinacea TaxID=29556 RepID=A0A6H0V261_9BACT|nr:hypothetical protein [Mycoplasmopsis gallinacea]QIW62421.1 hypothetical protein GOQ20_03295 [Mycoplasmopsis gallinacea]
MSLDTPSRASLSFLRSSLSFVACSKVKLSFTLPLTSLNLASKSFLTLTEALLYLSLFFLSLTLLKLKTTNNPTI